MRAVTRAAAYGSFVPADGDRRERMLVTLLGVPADRLAVYVRRIIVEFPDRRPVFLVSVPALDICRRLGGTAELLCGPDLLPGIDPARWRRFAERRLAEIETAWGIASRLDLGLTPSAFVASFQAPAERLGERPAGG